MDFWMIACICTADAESIIVHYYLHFQNVILVDESKCWFGSSFTKTEINKTPVNTTRYKQSKSYKSQCVNTKKWLLRT